MSTGARRPVLLVDDDPEWLELLAEQLEAAGLAVVAATDGRRAWRSFLRCEPLVVITDVQMPFMDGRELLGNVRARNFRVPVIVVTASEAQKRNADLSAAYVVLAKPADPDEIIATVKAAISHRVSHTPLAKIWTVAAPLPPLHNPAASLVARARWSKKRQRAAVLSVVIAALLVVAILAARRRAHPRR